METKPLLFGLIGFFIGGLTVSLAATYIEKPADKHGSGMTMSQMAESLADKKGEDYDKAYLTSMIEHHEGAVEMAKLSKSNAKHEEIKNLSDEIVAAQEKEIAEIKAWQKQWGYTSTKASESRH